MGKLFAGAKQIAFIDPANPSDTVVVSGVSPQTAIPAEFVTQPETTNGVVYGGRGGQYSFVFHKITSAGLAQLKEWKENDTPIQAVALLANGAFGAYESAEIQDLILPPMNARDGLFSYTVTTTMFGPYLDVYNSYNLMKVFFGADASGRHPEGEYNPKRAPAGSYPNILDNYGTFVKTGVGDDGLFSSVFAFPFSGVTLTLSCTADSAGDVEVSIAAVDSSGSLVGISTFADAVVNGQRISTSLLLPAGTHSIRVELNNPTGVFAGFSDTQIRIDGKTNFIS